MKDMKPIIDDNKALERAEVIAALRCCESRECSECPYQGCGIACKYRMMIDAADLLEQLTSKPPNDPLTLEELRGMDGEPVYIVRGSGDDGWAIVGVEADILYFHGPAFEDSPDEDFYGMICANTTCSQPCKQGLHQLGWLAYRSKPDGGGE